ncbi:MAG: molybdopterin molybdotransferase MoeA [Coriobacteriaceae bacterium]|nr:molybdopterin molybdotransferase MoeA [Coriobacteriaceae bacterium]
MTSKENPDAHMITVEDAQRIILERACPTPIEQVPTWLAAGRPLAEDVATDIDLAPFANSAMDGYAVRAQDLAAAEAGAPVELEVIGHEAAGHVFEGAVEPGTTVRIMTGAPVPEGADAVVKYEIVEVLEGDGNEGSRVCFAAPARVGDNIREAGLEAKRGEVVMHAGEVVTAAGAGLLANAGKATVAVHRAPRIGIVSLGTELVDAGTVPARGQIRDVNAPALMAAARDAGAEATFYGIAPDDEERICELVRRAAAECDLVVTSGGASAGDYDYVTALVEREGEVQFDRISMRPGKAVTFGMLGNTPFFGLSGNPAGAFIGFELFVRPAVRKMMGHAELFRPVQTARVAHDVKKRQERRFYNRARVERRSDTGELEVTQAPTQNSAMLVDLHRGNCLLVMPDGVGGAKAGDEVSVLRYDLPEGAVL